MPRDDGLLRECERLSTDRHWIATLVLISTVSVFYYGFCDSRGSLAGLYFFEIKHDFIGILFSIPVAYATLSLRLCGAVAAGTLCLAVVSPYLLQNSLGLESIAQNLGALALFFLLPDVALLELRWREKQRQIAAEREHERRLQIDRLFSVQEEERKRIAQGLHDDVLQRLLTIAYMAEDLADSAPRRSGGVETLAGRIRDESLLLSEDLRRLSYDLRPSILDSLGLVPAVNWLADRLHNQVGVAVRIAIRGTAARLDPLVETTAFRIVQEALNNVARHARATEADVMLSFSAEDVLLEVSDNGVGLPSGHIIKRALLDGHLGLLGMRERAASLNGALAIQSRPGGGTVIRAQLPTCSPATDATALRSTS